ncbi:MAG: tetratricopeptide repeat protein [Cyanophyceae cyanobacterium]
MTDSPLTDSAGSPESIDPTSPRDSIQLPTTQLEKELEEDRRSQARELLQRGKAAYESGRYRDAINILETATGVVQNPVSPLGGEISVWLVTAYEALGLRDSALGLCRTLCTHPDFTVRKQARRLLEILEAPQLNRPKEWMTEIPDLSSIEDGDSSQFPVAHVRPKSTKIAKEDPDLEPPLKPEERRYNDGLFWAIALILLVGALTVWAMV